jgi:F0F1-type ATP synthase alpha subunit
LSAVPKDKVKEFEVEYLERLEMKHKDVLETLKAGKLTPEVEETMKAIQQIMEEVLPLHIPLRVNIEAGKSWGAIH